MIKPTSLLIVLAACGASIPDNPTYFADVAPILRANCVRCHGADPVNTKIAKFRLDRYVANDTTTYDVYDYATGMNPDMIRVAVDLGTPAMPPDYELTDRQKQILSVWADHMAPKGTRDNHLPEVALVSPTDTTTADQSLDVSYRAWDVDLDGLVTQLWAHDSADITDANDVPLGAPTGGGDRTITADTGTLASKHTFEIYAVLDDGFFDDPAMNRTPATLIPSLYVDHGLRGTAPTVKLLSPNGGETLIGSATIQWSATDPDVGDSVTIDLALISVAADGTESIAATIATGLANSGSYMWTIPSSISATGAYKVRVTGTDMLGQPPNVRSDESDATFSIAQPTTTTYTWADVKPTFVTYCGACHGNPARTVAIDYFCLKQYQLGDDTTACAATDEGVYEVRSLVYQRLVSAGSMPPAGNPQPSASDVAMIGNWIQGGAPKGSGPADPPPALTWMAPTSTQTTAPVTLTWSATDQQGLTSGKLEYTKLNGLASSGCGAVSGNATWTAISDPMASASNLAGAMTWSGSFSWTPPTTASGYYCVRGSATDTSMQTTSVVNAYGIK